MQVTCSINTHLRGEERCRARNMLAEAHCASPKSKRGNMRTWLISKNRTIALTTKPEAKETKKSVRLTKRDPESDALTPQVGN